MQRRRGALKEVERKELDRLAENGLLEAKTIVREARKPNNPLHKRFDWDLRRAAEQHWLDEARRLIHVYVTVINGDHTPVRALVSLAQATGKPGYMPIRQALSSAETLAELREMFARDLLSVLTRYEYLRSKLRPVFVAVEAAAARVSGKRIKAA